MKLCKIFRNLYIWLYEKISFCCKHTGYRSGFAFFEVMTAVLIIGIVFGALLTLQNRVVKRCVHNTMKIERFYRIKNQYLKQRFLGKFRDLKDEHEESENRKKTEVVEELLESPEMKILYEQKSIKKESQLARFSGLIQETSTGSWREFGGESSCALVLYSCKSVKKPKEKQDASSSGKTI